MNTIIFFFALIFSFWTLLDMITTIQARHKYGFKSTIIFGIITIILWTILYHQVYS